jgi:hypothetical protein
MRHAVSENSRDVLDAPVPQGKRFFTIDFRISNRSFIALHCIAHLIQFRRGRK